MKKVFCVLLSTVLATLLLVGCSSEGNAAPNTSEPPNAEADNAAPSDEAPPPEEMPEEEAPLQEWAFDAPEKHGMDGAVLQSMHTALADTEIYSVVTVRDGVIVDEYYKEGYDETSVFALHSVSKSFTSALVGIALEEGLIKGLDTPISVYLPQTAGTDKADITIRQLLEHTGGFAWYEWNGRVDTFWAWRDSDNWVEFVLDQPLATTPGSTWNYTTGGTHLLSAILQEVTGQSSLEYGSEHLFAPLGMSSVEWGSDPQGINDGGNGIRMTARDAARFGQLYLNGGGWNGQQLIPASWVEQSTSAQVVRYTSSGSYGYQWWVRPFGDANYDAYYAMGAWGQFIFVVPELDLVTVITSNHPEDTYVPWPYFNDYVLASCG